MHGRRVTLLASEISWDGRTILELANAKDAFVRIDEQTATDPFVTDGPEKLLVGEIVDPKCFFGAMNPGQGKIHKSCAIRCLSGGIPAVLAMCNEGVRTYYIIRNSKGENMNGELMHLVGETVMISGKVNAVNNWNYLFVDTVENIKRRSFHNILEYGTDVLCTSFK
jgi:hypothetical protein